MSESTENLAVTVPKAWELVMPDFASGEDPDEKGFAVRLRYGNAAGREETVELRLAGDVGRDDPRWPVLRAAALRMFAGQAMYEALEAFVRRREKGQAITMGDLDRAAEAMRQANGVHLFARVPFPPMEREPARDDGSDPGGM